VRELGSGERPRDWVPGDDDTKVGRCPADEQSLEATAAGTSRLEASEAPALARVDAATVDELAAPQQYKVQFTATEEYVRLIEEAKALLGHAAPRATVAEVQLRALRGFVEQLRKRKYGSAKPADRTARDSVSVVTSESDGAAGMGDESPEQSVSDAKAPQDVVDAQPCGRHIPVAIRETVAARDGHRCSYVDTSGRRCLETRRLEFHHVVPFALRHAHEVSNVTLRCAAHNALAAEEDFGRQFVHERRNRDPHERFRAQEPG